MSSMRMKAVVTVLVIFSSCAMTVLAQMHSNMADADSAAIKQAVAAFTDAWNRHDPHAVAMLIPPETQRRGAVGIPRP